jgi:hypothetical protein
MMSRFWWGDKDNDKMMAWMSWKNLDRGKEQEGMVFKDLECRKD